MGTLKNHSRSILLYVMLTLIALNSFSQNVLKQTVRGVIVVTDTKIPLTGATVIVHETNPIMGTTTNPDENFPIEEIPVGRHIHACAGQASDITNKIVDR